MCQLFRHFSKQIAVVAGIPGQVFRLWNHESQGHAMAKPAFPIPLSIRRPGVSADITPIKVAQAAIGHWPQGALFSKDGKTVLAMNMVENELQVFSFTGYSLKETGRIKLDGGPAAGRTAGVN